MAPLVKRLLGELKQLPEEIQHQLAAKWLNELKQGDGALGEPQLEEKKEVSYDSIKHLLGVYDNLPSDLSSNKSHLDGYGKESSGNTPQ